MEEPYLTEPPLIAATCDGGDLDCGSGLLLIIRNAMAGIAAGGVLEIRSRERSVREDLPAWCRMARHDYLGALPTEIDTRYFVRKGQEMSAQERSLETDLAKARNFTWMARVRWTGELTAQAYVRNHSFVVGQPASFKEADDAPGAVDYLLGALGADMVVGFWMHASRRNLAVDDLEVSVRGKLGNVLVVSGLEESGSPGFASISATLYVRTDAEETAVRAVWEEVQRRSPLIATLKAAAQLDLRLVIDL